MECLQAALMVQAHDPIRNQELFNQVATTLASSGNKVSANEDGSISKDNATWWAKYGPDGDAKDYARKLLWIDNKTGGKIFGTPDEPKNATITDIQNVFSERAAGVASSNTLASEVADIKNGLGTAIENVASSTGGDIYLSPQELLADESEALKPLREKIQKLGGDGWMMGQEFTQDQKDYLASLGFAEMWDDLGVDADTLKSKLGLGTNTDTGGATTPTTGTEDSSATTTTSPADTTADPATTTDTQSVVEAPMNADQAYAAQGAVYNPYLSS